MYLTNSTVHLYSNNLLLKRLILELNASLLIIQHKALLTTKLKPFIVSSEYPNHKITMFSRGKGGKGLKKEKATRHRLVLRDNIQGITKPAIRRLARRGGVKRFSGLIYEETRVVLKVRSLSSHQTSIGLSRVIVTFLGLPGECHP